MLLTSSTEPYCLRLNTSRRPVRSDAGELEKTKTLLRTTIDSIAKEKAKKKKTKTYRKAIGRGFK